MSIAPAVYAKLPYNVFNDLAPISLVVINPQILVAHPSLPANTIKELNVRTNACSGRNRNLLGALRGHSNHGETRRIHDRNGVSVESEPKHMGRGSGFW